MENVEIQHESVDMSCTRKRRFSATGKDAFVTNNVSADDGSNNEADAAPAIKQRQLESVATEPCKNGVTYGGFTLEDFCDELLFEIFKHLDTWTILALMNSSPRFVGLLLDRRFWEDIDLSKGPLPLGILEDVLVRSNDKTHTIKICGPPSKHHGAGLFKQFTTTLTSIFPKLQSQLQVLEMQGVSLDFSYIHITDFPAALKRLVLKDCSVKIPDDIKSIFHTMDTHLKELEELGIEECDWFEPYYIMAISKLPVLRKLSLKGCRMLSKFVPYGSMAARFGFHKLEVLDLRLTPINNADLQCFGAVETLKELLLDCPERKPEDTEPSEQETLPDSSVVCKLQRRRSVEQNLCSGGCISEAPADQPPIVNQPKGYGRPLQPRPFVPHSHGPDVFDDDTPSTSSRATLSRMLFNRAAQRAREVAARRDKMDADKAEGSADNDDVPSTSSSAREMPKADNQNETSNTEAKLNGTTSPPPPAAGVGDDSESDTDNEIEVRKPIANGADDEERYSSSSPPLSLSDSVKVNASTFSDDSDDDDDDDDNDDTETRSTMSLSDPARESSPTTSRSSTHSDASNPSVVVIRLNANEGAAAGGAAAAAGGAAPGAAANPPPPTLGPSARAFILCNRPQSTIDDMIQRMEQIRSNVRLLHHRRSGNNPAYSRFVPRPCQIICMNPQNPREPLYVMHSRRAPIALGHQHQQRTANQFDQVMGHPMFWNMLDPLNVQGARRHRHRTTLPNVSTQVTDRAMYSFGRATNPVEPGVIWIRNINRAQNNQLERIELRNYTQITNLTLQHLMQCSPNLVYIDVSGTSVTRAGVLAFQELMPNCTVVATHIKEDDEAETQEPSCSTGEKPSSDTSQPDAEAAEENAAPAGDEAQDEQAPEAANDMQLLAPLGISPEAINAVDEAVARLVLPMRMPVPLNGEQVIGEMMERVNGEIEEQLNGDIVNQINGELVEQFNDELVDQLNDQLLEAAGVELPEPAENEQPAPSSPPSPPAANEAPPLLAPNEALPPSPPASNDVPQA